MARGRKPISSKFIYFDLKGYEKALKARLNEVMKEYASDIIKQMKSNLSSINFKTNKVRMVGGHTTTDAARKNSVINSIAIKELRWVNDFVFKTTITALDTNFKDSHIGVYYEYGTGENAEEAPGFEGLETPNPHRTGKTIVSRSAHIDYAGQGKGVWRDMGGNLRTTRSQRAGERTEAFIRYIGEDIVAYHWFSKALDEQRQTLLARYREAVKSVNIFDYIALKPKFVLGKD